MNAFTALALPLGAVLAGALYGLALVALDRLINRGAAHIFGRLSGLPTLVAPYGCDDCCIEDGEPHRYAGCPGNVHQHARQIGEWAPTPERIGDGEAVPPIRRGCDPGRGGEVAKVCRRTGKANYRSVREAEAAARQARDTRSVARTYGRTERETGAYQCLFCPYWHLTSQPQRGSGVTFNE